MISTRAATEQILAYKGMISNEISPLTPNPPPLKKKKKRKKSIARGKLSSSLKSYKRRQVTAAG